MALSYMRRAIRLFRRKKKNILLSLSVFLFLLIVLGGYKEYSLRSDFSEFIEARPQEQGTCTNFSDDDRLIYEYRKNHSPCGTNSLGFMDNEYSIEKPDDTYRIVLIGDSVAQGQGVSREDSFGNLLESKLNNQSDEINYEVIIFAVTGYSISQKKVLLEDHAMDFSPDLILWSYVLNDPADPVFHSANGELGKFFFRPRSFFFHDISERVFNIFEDIKDCPDEFHQMLHCAYFDKVESHLYDVKDISSGVPMILLIHPVFERSGFDFYSHENIHSDIDELASSLDFYAVDILRDYRDFDASELNQDSSGWFDTWHPNERGHDIIADRLYTEILNISE